MFTLRCATLLFSASVFLALVTAQETGLGTCTDMHIFLSRGYEETYPGRQGTLVEAICAGLSSCDYEDVVYNNSKSVNYCTAVAAGREAGRNQITDYNKKCPDSTLVVSGYSQGAQVLADILGGGGGSFISGCTTPSYDGLDLESLPTTKIAAALLFGDVTHTANQSYNQLAGSSINGMYPRSGQQLDNLNKYEDMLHSWCQDQDPVCAKGDGTRAYNYNEHLDYFDFYSDTAAKWARSMVNKFDASSSSSSTASDTATASGSSTTATGSVTTTATITADSSGTTSATTSATATSTSDSAAGIPGCSNSLVGLAMLVSFIFTIT